LATGPVWPSGSFAYHSLYDVARIDNEHHQLTAADIALFESLETRNFEFVLAGMATARRVNMALGIATAPIPERYASIQQALVEAVRSTHVPWARVPRPTFEAIRGELLNYRFVYSTNYDLLIYWAIMHENGGGFKDFFWAPYFDPANTELWGKTTAVLYLHGGLHLYHTLRGRTLKQVAAEGLNLLDLFGTEPEPGATPLFISEGSAEDKLESIHRSDYLAFSYTQLAHHEGPLCVFGHSLGEADQHRLVALVAVLNQKALGLTDVEPDLFGQAYEYLLRKFAEGQGSSAGEFFTPPEAARLMARILDPEPGQTVYDPCCGSGGLLIKAHLRLVEKYGVLKNGAKRLPLDVAHLRLFGQDIGAEKFAMTRMNAVIHDMEAEVAPPTDTMTHSAFTNTDGSLRQFDLVTANPMWNQKFPPATYENDPFDRFTRGIPPSSSADWGWIQHMAASLSDTGKMAVVLDTGAVSRGSGNQGSNRERDVRKAFLEADLIEAVFLLPENLFYNTVAPGIILVINHRKSHPGHILLINGSKQFTKGRPKNYLADEADAYLKWEAVNGLSAIVSTADAAKNDFQPLAQPLCLHRRGGGGAAAGRGRSRTGPAVAAGVLRGGNLQRREEGCGTSPNSEIPPE
jgi:hypothetical protein